MALDPGFRRGGEEMNSDFILWIALDALENLMGLSVGYFERATQFELVTRTFCRSARHSPCR